MNNPLSRSEFLAEAGLLSTDRIAVVDIGSNSVRLVVYDQHSRLLVPLHNEKIFCGIGRRVASTRRLDEEGVQRAIVALERFQVLLGRFRARRIEAVATAAVREAENGREFVAHAEDVLGAKIRILSGEEEARLSALGVISGIPDAEGVVGDLGGGSLELVRVSGGTTGEAITLPLGPLRLIDQQFSSNKAARAYIDAQIARVPWIKAARGKVFYLVGGSWRNLARLHLDPERHPLAILHQYSIDADDAAVFARSISKLGRKSLESITTIPKKRLEGLPFAALVLERLIDAFEFDSVMVSAHGLREGIIADLHRAQGRTFDPLISAAQDLCAQMARDWGLCAELIDWTAQLFPRESVADKRLRTAVCWLCDIAWRTHPEYRSEVAFAIVRGGQFSGVDHVSHAFLALALHERYPDGRETEEMRNMRSMLPEEMRDSAKILGLALRLGITLAGACAGTLPQCPLVLDGGAVEIKVPKSLRALRSESVRKRLDELNDAIKRSQHIDLI